MWELLSTDHECIHCESRGFKSVNVALEVYYTEIQRKRRQYDQSGVFTLVEVPGRAYKTVTSDDGTIAMITRLRCPHWPCKTNNPIRDRQKKHRTTFKRAAKESRNLVRKGGRHQ